jgi:predicted TIM-barrel fold metal-dependent hydrolase
MAEINAMEIRSEAKDKLLRANALKLFRLPESGAAA